MPRKQSSSITLCLDPGTKEMGIAVLSGRELLDYRVKTFRNGRKVHELLTQARDTMVQLLKEIQPQTVVIERPFFAQTKRSALLTFLVQELHGQLSGKPVRVADYGPRQVREILLDDPKATKRDIARYVAKRFPELQQHLHFGDFWREKYWSHIFDAVALGLADQTVRERRRS